MIIYYFRLLLSSIWTSCISLKSFVFFLVFLNWILSYKVLKTFKFTWKNILGVGITTLAGVIITINSLYNNIQVKKNEENKLDKLEQEKLEKTVKIENEQKS